MTDGTDFSYVEKAQSYVDQVLDGSIPSCKWVKKVCERHERDKDNLDLYLDPGSAERACRFMEKLPHIKGRWAGSPISLELWQIFILVSAFGWKYTATGLRRFRTVYIEVPRKNAKSTLSSGVGLYLTVADDEGGSEVYSAATTRDQARIVFNDAQRMARKSKGLLRHFGTEVLAHSIHQEDTASYFRPLSAEGNSLDGLNVHGGIIDELHAHKTRVVFDVIETGTGAREQSLLWLITTAGSNRAGICYEQRTYVTKILDNVTEDDSYFGIIYTIDDVDDWTDPEVWSKANPNYSVSVFPDDIARLCKKAQQMPSAQNNFLTKRLNVWVNADTSWMEMRSWDRCSDHDLTLEDFEGCRCMAALDLASKVDIAALVLLFEKEGHYYAFGKYYLPEDTIETSGNSQYQGWVNDNRLIATPGNVIDFDWIKSDLQELSERFELIEVPYDPFQATQLSTQMTAEGFPMVEMRPTVLNFSEPMKELEALVLSKKFHFDGCPVLTWMVSNVVCHLDNKDNIYPRKERPENKIDGVVALIMALGRYLVQSENNSVYEDRGITSF